MTHLPNTVITKNVNNVGNVIVNAYKLSDPNEAARFHSMLPDSELCFLDETGYETIYANADEAMSAYVALWG